MDSVDALGMFWFPGHREAAEYGRLKFDPVSGGSLELQNDLGELLANDELHVVYPNVDRRILGTVDLLTGKEKVTLIDCGSGAAKKWFVNTLLVGDHFEEESDSTFDEVTLRLDGLSVLASRDIIDADVDHENPELTLTISRPPDDATPIEGGTVALRSSWDREEVEFERYRIAQWSEIDICYETRVDLATLSKHVSQVYNYVTMCSDRAANYDSIYLYTAERPQTSLAGTPFAGTKKRIELKARYDKFSDGLRKESRQQAGIFATIGELGGVSSLARFIALSEVTGTVIDAFLTARSQLFGENRFLNQVAAAEGLHRVTVGGNYLPPSIFRSLRRHIRKGVPVAHHPWFNEVMAHANDPSLARRLTELASEMNDIATELVGDVERWARVMTRTRNVATHLSEAGFLADGAEFYWLGESLFQFIRMAILLRMEVPPSTLAMLARRGRISQYRDRCVEIVDRLAPASHQQ